MRRRFNVTLDVDWYRETQARAIRAGKTVGQFLEEAVPMDETVKKAIEPDVAKQGRGGLRKGLGDLPGEDRVTGIRGVPGGRLDERPVTPAPKKGQK